MKQLTKEEMTLRLENGKNLINIIHRGDCYNNGSGNNGRAGIFTPEEKENIVALSKEVGMSNAAALTNCHPQSIGDFARGISSHRGDEMNVPSTHQKQNIMEGMSERVSERAIEKVLRSLDLMEDNKLKACNAVELATVASRLANIGIKKGVESGRIQVNIFSTPVRTEQDFEVVEIA